MDAASRLERIIGIALTAQALALKEPDALDGHLDSIDADFVGFAIEGGSMGLTMLGQRDPEQAKHMEALRSGRWAPFSVLMHAGTGLAVGELGADVVDHAETDPDLLAGFAVDGYGFHLGFIAPDKYLGGQPNGFNGDAARLIDNGLGRALWFFSGADPAAVVGTVPAFDAARHGDLWAGIAFAATYAGGLRDASALLDAAGRDALATGSALAAHVRIQSGNLVDAVDETCQALSGRKAADADRICTDARPENDSSLAAFVAWRDRIGQALAAG